MKLRDHLGFLANFDTLDSFEQAQKEVDDLHQRTREGIETARRAGKQIGRPGGEYIL